MTQTTWPSSRSRGWTRQSDAPFVQHNKVDCKDCDVEEEWNQDESDNPSQEVLCDFHLEPENKAGRAQNSESSQSVPTAAQPVLLFTSERLRSPSSLQRSQTVFSPTSRTTNRPTNFTPKAPARFTPVSTSHSHQDDVNGLNTNNKGAQIECKQVRG